MAITEMIIAITATFILKSARVFVSSSDAEVWSLVAD